MYPSYAQGRREGGGMTILKRTSIYAPPRDISAPHSSRADRAKKLVRGVVVCRDLACDYARDAGCWEEEEGLKARARDVRDQLVVLRFCESQLTTIHTIRPSRPNPPPTLQKYGCPRRYDHARPHRYLGDGTSSSSKAEDERRVHVHDMELML